MRARLFLIPLALAVGAAAAYKTRIEPWWRSWGVDPDESDRALPGDDIVPDPDVVDTRAVTIAAPPSAVWPWLVQMGYGRAGWYSYDAIDMRGSSAAEILPEHQQLEVGDLLPTHPGGGFRVRVVEPGRTLVLSMDPTTVQPPAEGRPTDAAVPDDGTEATPANLRAAGAFLDSTMSSDFSGSWAFVLEPADGGRTRLIERLRLAMEQAGPGARVGGGLLGFGVFLMVRRQLLGIRDRVEQAEGSVEPLLAPAPA